MQSAWNQVKTLIHKKLPHHTFMVWIEPLEFIDLREDGVVLRCPNTFARKWVMSHYMDLIKAEQALQQERKTIAPEIPFPWLVEDILEAAYLTK